MAIVTTVPLVWGVSTGHEAQAEWIALTAESICWVALKGTSGQRIRVMAGGAFLALFFGALGSITGGSLWLSVGCMLLVAFLAGLFKNLGERGSGLSICVYLLFLITNAHPVAGKELGERLVWLSVGGIWNLLLGIIAFIFMPVQQPYRRTIALIWKAAAGLAAAVRKGWDGMEVRSSAREIYIQERAVRVAIDGSFAFYEKMAHQVSKGGAGKQEYQLAQVRKAAALVASHISAIHDEVDTLTLKSIDATLRSHLHTLMQAIENLCNRAAVLVLTLRAEEELLFRNRMERLQSVLLVLQEYKGVQSLEVARAVRRILMLGARAAKLLERSSAFLEALEEQPVYRSYSLVKTVLVLHPKHWWRNIRILFNADTHTFRYALRTALAATMALFIYKWQHIDHGYWLPFTVIIVLQPYFGATLRKALDRVIGTLAGGLAGGLLILLPAHLHLKELIMFAAAVAMIFFYRRKYTISAFFITLNLVLLFSISEELSKSLILIRAVTTLGGAVLAIAAGFLLLPTWDKKYLPRHIRSALRCNWDYYRLTILENREDTPWTRYKRGAETENSNAFDSFNRFMQEYHRDSKNDYRVYYNLITHNVRITREINNLNLERDAGGKEQSQGGVNQQKLMADCTVLFVKIIGAMGGHVPEDVQQATISTIMQNEVYLERLQSELKAMYAAVAGMRA